MSGDHIGALAFVALAALAILWAVVSSKSREVPLVVDLALIVDTEEDEWAPWLRQVPDLDETPLYVESWAHIFRRQLDDEQAIERWLGGAA